MLPTPPRIGANGVEVSISAEFYWKYVNYGVNGTERNVGATRPNTVNWKKVSSPDLSFKDSISQWIRHKGITLPEGFTSYDSLSYVMMRNIKEQGKEPRPFFTDVVNSKLKDVLKKPIEKLIGRSIEVAIVEPWQ